MKTYLEEKIVVILLFCSFVFLVSLFFGFFMVPFLYILIFVFVMFGLFFGYLFLSYWILLKRYQKMISLVDHLEEIYLISEVLKKPKGLENQAYFYALKRSSKAYLDRIGLLETEALEYQEYVERFAHEIKTPISVLSLMFDNQKNYEMKQEVQKIERLLEQMLYYARSRNTENDYFVKELLLSDVVHSVVLDFRESLLLSSVKLDIHDLERTVYSDEKWICFIISQVVQNAIKYMDGFSKKLEIYSLEHQNNIVLVILDNGIGIKEYDLGRVFEKWFTGSDRTKTQATGMGLYLAKKLCDRLGLEIRLESKENVYTKVCIVFPKSHMYMKD